MLAFNNRCVYSAHPRLVGSLEVALRALAIGAVWSCSSPSETASQTGREGGSAGDAPNGDSTVAAPDASHADASALEAEAGGDATIDAAAASRDAEVGDGADAAESGPAVATPGAPCPVDGAEACSAQAPQDVLTCSGNPLVWTPSPTGPCSQPTPVCLGAACVCPAAFRVCSGVCLDPAGDPANCGACGHSCLGGACQKGACQPVVLASGQGYPMTIVVDSTSVYWTDSLVGDAGAIMRVPLDGGAPTQIVNAGSNAYGLAVDGTSAYWTNRTAGPGVAKVSLDGGTPTALAWCTGAIECMAVAVAGSQVYFATTQMTMGDLRRVSVSGGDASLVAPEETYALGTSFALSPGGIYWPSYQSLLWVPLDGGAPVPVATSTAAQGVAVDGANVYWTDVWGGSGAGLVMRLPLDGGSPVPVASQLSSPEAIAVDSVGVYWTDYPWSSPFGTPGSVLMAPLDGGAPVVLATAQSYPVSIAVDATRVYWVNTGATENSGTVMAIAKP